MSNVESERRLEMKINPVMTDIKWQKEVRRRLRKALADREVARQIEELVADWGIEEDLPRFLYREILEASF